MKQYSKEEKKIVKDKSLSIQQIADKIGRTYASVQCYRSKNGIVTTKSKGTNAMIKAWKTRKQNSQVKSTKISNIVKQTKGSVNFIINGVELTVESKMLPKVAICGNKIKIDY